MYFIKATAVLLTTCPIINADAPWFTLISNTEVGQGFTRCGGVLVHPDIVLTASNCAPGSDTYLRVGYKSDANSTLILTPDELSQNNGIIDHPEQWGKNGRFQENLPNDITIIKLNQTVTEIKPIKLDNNTLRLAQDNTQLLHFAHAGALTDFWDVPKKGFPVSDPSKLYSMGYFVNSDLYHPILKEGDVYTEEFIACKREYIEIPGYQAELDETLQFCVNQNTSSACDSNAWGSPLYSNKTGEPTLVGLASQGECTLGGLPFVYTRIAHYFEYILETICELSNVTHPNNDCSEFQK